MYSISDPTQSVVTPPDGGRQWPDLRRAAEAWSAELDGLNVTSFLVSVTVQRLSQHVERAFIAVARRYELGPGDARILLVLRRSGPNYAVSPTELFRQLLITSGAVSKQVDRLVEVGLVTRVPDPETLRGLLVRLEPPGRDIADAMMREICTSFCGLERLGPEQAHEILDVLARLQALMEQAESGELPATATKERPS